MAEEIETMGFWSSLNGEQELKGEKYPIKLELGEKHIFPSREFTEKELDDFLFSIFFPLTEQDSNRCPTDDEGEE